MVYNGCEGLRTDTAVVRVTIQLVQTFWADAIQMGLNIVGINNEATAVVQVVSAAGPVAGASVTGDWYHEGSLLESGAVGVTGADGTVQFTSPKLKAKSGEVFRFVVTAVSAPDYVYDPGAGITEGSISTESSTSPCGYAW